jgi:hypothetical protein
LWASAKDVEGIIPVEEMNDPRALTWDVAFLAGALRDLV